MKTSLWKELRKYSKTKNVIPFDERQMDTLKDLYFELAKTLILSFMVFFIAYGYMEMHGEETSIGFMPLSLSMLGTITYYYTLRFCYLNVIGMDVNFEVLLVPAFIFTPFMFLHTISIGFDYLGVSKIAYLVLFSSFPLFIYLLYRGANRVYLKGKGELEQEVSEGKMHFRSRRQIVNWVIIATIIICALPIPYDIFFQIAMLLGCIFIEYNIIRYGFTKPQNDYILDEKGLTYHKALWGRKGGFIAYEDIEDVLVQDTFNIGYSKDKIRIHTRVGDDIYLYPENSFLFCMELKNNI